VGGIGTSETCHEETHAPQRTISIRSPRWRRQAWALHCFGTNAHGQFGSHRNGCPRYVRFTDAFLVAPHQDRRHLSKGFGESPLVSRPRGRLNGARIHTLEFSKISEEPPIIRRLLQTPKRRGRHSHFAMWRRRLEIKRTTLESNPKQSALQWSSSARSQLSRTFAVRI